MRSFIQAVRFHDISCGHRVVGHENKCRGLHGHNYRIHFECRGALDTLGRVIDFSVLKTQLCDWLEDNWDHKMLLWEEDPLMRALPYILVYNSTDDAMNSIVTVPFNPTAENMALYLLHVIAPQQLKGLDVICEKVIVEETRKCSASARLA